MLKKKTKKTLIITSSIVAPASIGLGVTLFAIHSNEIVNNNTVYHNLLQGENLFKIYSPYFQTKQQDKDAIEKSYQEAKNVWNDKDKSLLEKLNALDRAQADAFNFYIANLDKVDFKDQEPTQFWTKILNNQDARIRELDLKDKLTQLKEDRSLKFFDVLYSANNEQKIQYLNTLSQEISKLVVEQNKMLEPYINLLQGTSNKIDDLLFEGLKKEVASSLVPLYSRIISGDIRLNEVQIASQDTTKEVKKLDQMLKSSQTEINEINEYLKLIEPYTESVTYTDQQKQNVKNFLHSTRINLDLALTKADINSIRNDLVTFYQQISDVQRSVSEIKEVINGLNKYIDEFDPILEYNKSLVRSQIDNTLSISDKNALISAKANLFSEFYSLKFVNELILELKDKVKTASDENLISESKAIIANSQIDSIINRKIPNKELASEIFSFYNSEINELDSLDYLNNELKLLQNQSEQVRKLAFTNEEVINKLNELDNQIVKSFSNDVNSSYLGPINKQLNESLRLIFKDDLKQLINQLDEQAKLLKNLDNPANESILNEAKKLNQESLPMIEDFSLVPTATLIEQIKTYDLKLQNVINAYKQTLTENISNFTDDYLRVVFSENDPNYIPTPNEQKRINLYNEHKKRLDELRDIINKGDGNPGIYKELEEITAKLRNLTDTAKDFYDLSNLDKLAQETIKRKATGDNSAVLQPYIDELEKVRKQLDAVFADPNATKEQIQDLINQLNQAINNLNKADTKVVLEQKNQDLKNILDQKYPNGASSPAADAIRKQYEQLVEDAKDVSNSQKSNDAIDLANQLIKITPVAFELEVNKKRLLDIIGEKNSAQYKGNKTNDAIAAGRTEIQNADELVARLNDRANIPNVEAFENEKNQLLLRGNEILLAYEQDKIEKLNTAIQATTKSQTTEANTRYKESLTHINNYAIVKKSELIFDKAKEAADKLEKLNALAQVSSKLLDFYNLYNTGNTTSLAGYIASLLANNELISSDTNQEIDKKVTNLTNDQEIISAKKEYLDEYQNLETILNTNNDWKIYQSLNRQISLIKEQTNSIIFDNNLSAEQIRAKKVELSANINTFTREKTRLLEEFNQAVNTASATLNDLEAKIAKLKQNNSTYSFAEHFDTVKANFTTDKEIAQRANVDTADISAYNSKLQVAFKKDLALNKLKDIKAFANGNNYGSSDLHTKAKNAISPFETYLKAEFTRTDLTLEQVDKLVAKVEELSNLINLEKRVADHVAVLEQTPPRTDVQTLSTAALKEKFNNTLPSSDNNYDDLHTRFDDLKATFDKEKLTIEEIRNSIIFALKNQDNTKGAYGLVKMLTDALGHDYDNSVTNKLTAFVNTIESSTKSSSDQTELNKILDKVTKAKREVNSLAALAQAVAQAQTRLNGLTNNNSALINNYSSKLNGYIAEARNAYFKDSTTDNNPTYTELKNKISFTSQKIQAADSLATTLSQIRAITNNAADFNLHNIDNQSGVNKLNDLNNYLQLFETSATNDTFTADAVAKIQALAQKAQSFKTIIELDNTVLATVNTWVGASSPVNATDIKSLLSLVWDSIPTTNSSTTLGKKAGATYNVSQLHGLNDANTISAQAYNELAEKITREITTEHANIQTRNTYRKATDTKIQDLKKKMFTPLVHNALKDSLLTYIGQLETQNNTQTSLTITPVETGELNKINAKVKIIETKFDQLKQLAQKAYELENLNNQIITMDATVTTAKTKANELIAKAKTYYNDPDKMNKTDGDSISNVQAQLEDQYYRLNLLSKYQIVSNLFKNDKSLNTEEKAVIQGKLDSFNQEYNTTGANAPTPQSLFNKYFREESEVQANEPASAKNSLIKYVLENAIELKKAYTQAQEYLTYKDVNIDDADVTSKLNAIQQELTNANNPINANKNNNNDEQTKLQFVASLHAKVEQLIQSKKDQIARQITKDQEVKNYIDQNASTFNPNNNPDPYVDNFQMNAIDDLNTANTNKDNLNYSEINIILQKAQTVLKTQIFDLYKKGYDEVTKIYNSASDYLTDFDATHVNVRNGSGILANDYSPLLALKALVDTALSQDITSIENYTTKINSFIDVIHSNAAQTVLNFVVQVKQAFYNKFNENGQLKGFYVNLFKKLDPLKNDITGKTQNNYEYNDLRSLEAQYDVLKSEYEVVKRFYNIIQNKNDSSSLSAFALQVDQLNKLFVSFYNSIHDQVINILANNPLANVFKDIYNNVNYGDNNPYTQNIETAFNSFKNTITSLANQLTIIDIANFDFSTLNTQSQDQDKIFNIISQLHNYKDWVFDHKNMLLNPLDVDPSRINLLKPTAQVPNLDATFNKKYKVITAKPDYTRKQFINRFEEIAQHNALANPNSTDLVRIDNDNNFLEMFDQFAFTNKDIIEQNDVKSIFSPITFKVFIQKYDPSAWFQVVDEPTKQEVDRRTLKAKLVYEYDSNITGLGSVKAEREVLITFRTTDIIAIPDQNSSVFYTPTPGQGSNNAKVGINAKAEAMDVDEAGWNIAQVNSKNDANYNSVRDQVILKVYNRFKESVFDLLPGVTSYAEKDAMGISKEKPTEYAHEVYQNSNHTTELNTIDSLQGALGTNRISAYFSYDNPSQYSDYPYFFDFDNQKNINVTFNTSLSVNKADEYLRIFPVDEEKGIAFLQIQGGTLTGFGTAGSNSAPPYSPQRYDARIRGNEYNAYRARTDYWNLPYDKLPTAVNLNLYKFNIDYDPIKRKVYFYNSWLENEILLPNPNSFGNSIKSFLNLTTNSLRSADRDFLQDIVDNYTNNPSSYIPTPRDLSRAIALVSTRPQTIYFGASGTGASNVAFQQLPNTISTALGTSPIFPVNGGQQSIYRGSTDNPMNATLKPVGQTPFDGNSDQFLLKESARAPLYSAAINKFWFKIRLRN
ncbi:MULTISPECIES: hypothetical protein [unclassified Mycoplasma]|uniref:hypothetical protein n=1 Tax=unclassified Mycoplasma TaxID=2683645 RepID=UPI00211BBDE7|nr:MULTISPECIES: hypothetical protein [unclassified Mycoplasma]UUM19501.1 hypothetical protein NPA11_01830 [Mycoplasma sp. 1578d]UUM25124.1 hypothetical protein NPA12_01805 [Mycoplasma sp. 3686d]